eukprot:g48920.t1
MLVPSCSTPASAYRSCRPYPPCRSCQLSLAPITLLSKAASKSSHSSDGLGGLHELHLQCDTDRFTMIL